MHLPFLQESGVEHKNQEQEKQEKLEPKTLNLSK